MLRVLFAAAAALTLCAPEVFACAGQTGKVIFEDKFTDDLGGWTFSDANFKAPGAIFKLDASDDGSGMTQLNETFTATLGDFCSEGSFPADAARLKAGVAVVFWATDYSNFWTAAAYADGEITLKKFANRQWTDLFTTTTNNIVKTGPTDVNSVRAVVKDGTITVIVNGQTTKSVRAQVPAGNLKFGFRRSYQNSSTEPVLFPILSYKVTAVQ